MLGISLLGTLVTVLACCLAALLVFHRLRLYEKDSPTAFQDLPERVRLYQQRSLETHCVTRCILLLTSFIAIGSTILTWQVLYSPTLDIALLTGQCLSFILAPCLFLPCIFYDLLGILFVDTTTLADLLGTRLKARQAFTDALRGLLFGSISIDNRFSTPLPLSLPAFLLLELSGILCIFRFLIWLWLIPVVALLGTILSSFCKRHLLTWTARATTLEHSSWGSLMLHVGRWARRASIHPSDIYVYQASRVGRAECLLVAARRPLLFMSNVFLTYTEWRQQDALLASLLRCASQSHSPFSPWLNVLLSSLPWLLLTFLLAAIITIKTPFLFLLFGILLLISLLIYLALTNWKIRQQQRHFLEADSVSVQQTRDPIAIIVALHTHTTLNSRSRRLPSSMQRRIHALEKLWRQPEPQHPWLASPVPSAVPFTIRGRSLTTILDDPVEKHSLRRISHRARSAFRIIPFPRPPIPCDERDQES